MTSRPPTHQQCKADDAGWVIASPTDRCLRAGNALALSKVNRLPSEQSIHAEYPTPARLRFGPRSATAINSRVAMPLDVIDVRSIRTSRYVSPPLPGAGGLSRAGRPRCWPGREDRGTDRPLPGLPGGCVRGAGHRPAGCYNRDSAFWRSRDDGLSRSAFASVGSFRRPAQAADFSTQFRASARLYRAARRATSWMSRIVTLGFDAAGSAESARRRSTAAVRAATGVARPGNRRRWSIRCLAQFLFRTPDEQPACARRDPTARRQPFGAERRKDRTRPVRSLCVIMHSLVRFIRPPPTPSGGLRPRGGDRTPRGSC